jgi:DDE superfamily endonuclease
MLNPVRLVFIDETASSTNMVRLRGRCLRGERLIGSVPHGHRKTITLVAGLRHDRVVAPFVIASAMNGSTFLTYVERCLAPTLHRGDIVIIDNLPAHKVAGVTDAIEAVGARAVYLPPFHRISTRSNSSSANSRRCCARRRSELFRVFCEKFVRSCAPSAPMSA